MNFMATSGELIFLVGMFSFLFWFGHYLFYLLLMEFIVMSIFFLFLEVGLIFYVGLDFLFVFLSMMIMEGVYGLVVLVNLSRGYGSDYVSLFFL